MTIYDKHGHDVTIRDTQVCTSCHAEKSLAEYFFSRRNRGSGYSDICKLCVSAAYATGACHKSCGKTEVGQDTNGMPFTDPAQWLAKSLNYEHDEKGRTWRQIADDYPGVKNGTLNRIANSNGRWTPKAAALRGALGLDARRGWLEQVVENLEQCVKGKHENIIYG